MATNDQFTIRAREALAAAAELARVNGNPEITPEHLLLALTAEPDATASVLLRGAGADREAVRSHAESAVSKLPTASGATTTQQPSLAFRETIDRARKEARDLGDQFVAVEHLLLALADRLGRGGAARTALLEAAQKLRGAQRADDENAEERYDSLSRFGRWFDASTRFRRRMPLGVISTSSSSLMNSMACSSPRIRGGMSRIASSADEARMLVCFFSLQTFTSMSLARAFSPMIMPS